MHSLEIIDLIIDTIIIFASKIRGFKLSQFPGMAWYFAAIYLQLSDNHWQKSILKHAYSVQFDIVKPEYIQMWP